MPDDRLGTVELAERYRISPQRAWQLMQEWSEADDGPNPTQRSGRWYVPESELERWEQCQRDAGHPLPGERRRGPHPDRA